MGTIRQGVEQAAKVLVVLVLTQDGGFKRVPETHCAPSCGPAAFSSKSGPLWLGLSF